MNTFLSAFENIPDPRAENASHDLRELLVGPANIAVLRRRALDVARRDTSKDSLSIKPKRAGWDDAYLIKLLNVLAEA